MNIAEKCRKHWILDAQQSQDHALAQRLERPFFQASGRFESLFAAASPPELPD